MTRINLIPVQELTDQHLLAEHREIKRIPNTIYSGKYKLENIPNKYCMGQGHVKFFYNKPIFLARRYLQLYNECKKRGFNITDYYESFIKVQTVKELFEFQNNIYIPKKEEIEISKQRIKEKIQAKPLFYKYYGRPYELNKNTTW